MLLAVDYLQGNTLRINRLRPRALLQKGIVPICAAYVNCHAQATKQGKRI
jgi:hypothetical protein